MSRLKIDVRLALLKNFDVNLEQTYRDYKKFRATAKIVSVGDVKDRSRQAGLDPGPGSCHLIKLRGVPGSATVCSASLR